MREELWWQGYEIRWTYIRQRVRDAVSSGLRDQKTLARVTRSLSLPEQPPKFPSQVLNALKPAAVKDAVFSSSEEQINEARDEIRRLQAGPIFEKLSSDQKMVLLARWLSLRQLLEVKRWYGVTLLLATIAKEEREGDRE